jgi:hypothetical protein
VEIASRFRPSPERLLLSNGGVTALAACFFTFSLSLWAQANPCDLNNDGVVNNADVTLAINMALGIAPCSVSIEGPSTCTVITVQRVFNASLGQPCVVYNAHAAILSWTASISPNVTYNVYRSSASTGPYTQVNSSSISGTTFTDTSVQAGQTYYYVATAVASNSSQSAYSSPPAQATIPSP